MRQSPLFGDVAGSNCESQANVEANRPYSPPASRDCIAAPAQHPSQRLDGQSRARSRRRPVPSRWPLRDRPDSRGEGRGPRSKCFASTVGRAWGGVVDFLARLRRPHTMSSTSPVSLATFLALVFVVVLAFVALGAVAWRRAAEGRRALNRSLHDRALALDQRCDTLQDQVDALALDQRITALHHRVGRLSGTGRLTHEAARHLDAAVADLARQRHADHIADRSEPRSSRATA